MSRPAEDVVWRALREYAGRGVIRELSEASARGRRVEYRFEWLFDQPFRLRYEIEKDRLTLVDVIPDVQRGSRLYQDVKRFLAEHNAQNGGLPKHRVVDPKRAQLSMRSRGGVLSIVLDVKKRQRTYGVRRMLNVVHELFVFLRAHHEEYLWEHFGLPQE